MLDISLPDINGWRVLKRLKHDPTLRHIPVYVVSSVDQPERGLQLGARGVLPKPIQTEATLERFLEQALRFVEKTVRHVVLCETEAGQGERFRELIGGPDVVVSTVRKSDELLRLLRDKSADLAVLCGPVSEATLDSLADQVVADPALRDCPFLLLEAKESESTTWNKALPGFNLKTVESLPRLVDEATAALCRPTTALTESARQTLRELHDPTASLASKKVLIVDDDIRNIFALTSILERYDMVTIAAETGRAAVNLLQSASDIDIVLMDIMMPEMDGIDTMRVIRKLPQWKNLPIVAVTAKAMKGDREKCIEAGAWDYLSKPVNSEQMLSVLRAWLTE
jgi:CheY-like chemotaxis protein